MRTRKALILGLTLIWAGCGKSSPTEPGGGGGTSGLTVTITAGSGGAYDDPAGNRSSSGFQPGVLAVATGATVTWSNQDSVSHSPTADGGAFGGEAGPGGVFKFTFQNPGAFTYHCSIHPAMTGEISVK